MNGFGNGDFHYTFIYVYRLHVVWVAIDGNFFDVNGRNMRFLGYGKKNKRWSLENLFPKKTFSYFSSFSSSLRARIFYTYV